LVCFLIPLFSLNKSTGRMHSTKKFHRDDKNRI